MATSVLDVGLGWSSAARYTASGETEIMLSNSGGGLMFWAITAGDTAPTVVVRKCHPLKALQSIAMTLADTERLWIAGANGSAAVEA